MWIQTVNGLPPLSFAGSSKVSISIQLMRVEEEEKGQEEEGLNICGGKQRETWTPGDMREHILTYISCCGVSPPLPPTLSFARPRPPRLQRWPFWRVWWHPRPRAPGGQWRCCCRCRWAWRDPCSPAASAPAPNTSSWQWTRGSGPFWNGENSGGTGCWVLHD